MDLREDHEEEESTGAKKMTAADCTPPTARDKTKHFDKSVNDAQFSVKDYPHTKVLADPGIDVLATCVIYGGKARREEGTTHFLIFWLICRFRHALALLSFALYFETGGGNPKLYKRRKRRKVRFAAEQEFGMQCFELTNGRWRHECKRTDDRQAAREAIILKKLSDTGAGGLSYKEACVKLGDSPANVSGVR